MFAWQHVTDVGSVGAVKEHADEYHAANDVANGDGQEVPENALPEGNSRSEDWPGGVQKLIHHNVLHAH